MSAQATVIIIGLVLLAFLGFGAYFIFKALQFVVQAVKLYKDMISRQDMMIRQLSDIHDAVKSKE
jgi:predicted MPP superfamily phosphohydrolase